MSLQQVKDPTPKHYKYTFRGIKLDPYRILWLYRIGHPAQQHAIKKLLRAGQSIKELEQDIDEVIDTLVRWKEMIREEREMMGEAA
jgi:hypothetical protein